MRLGIFSLMLLALVITACGKEASANNPPPDPASVGDRVVGAEVFNTRHGDAPSCSFCHEVESSRTRVGPSLQGIADRAGSRMEGVEAVDYLRQSIVEPNAFIADGKTPNRMYQHFGTALSDEEIDNLVAYLLTLRE